MARRHMPDLRRQRYRREPRRRFMVLCEGENTEPAYLAALNRAFFSALIQVETIAGAGVPYTVARSAVEQARAFGLARRSRKPPNSFEERDEVWAVFDRDEHPRFNEAVALCQAHGVGVARSDPCFELWLILHEEDYDRPEDRHAVQARLQQLRPEYNRRAAKKPDCNELIARVEEAEGRANVQLLRRQDEGKPYGRPSTTVGHLTRAIRDAAERAR
jgi:RloB-like protein